MAARLKWLPKLPEVGPAPAAEQRDLALDFVRAWSLLVVVFGHSLMQIQLWIGEVPLTGNTLTSGGPWPFVTWLLQVMPLFFIAGGAVNQRSLERFDGQYNQWLWQRVRRLMQPTLAYLLAMSVVFTVVSQLVPRETTDPLLAGMAGPLWFLAVYIPVTALAPVSSRWWRAAGVSSLLWLGVTVAVVDWLRFQVNDLIGVLNLLVAWLFAHQLGYWYRQGVSSRVALSSIAGGLLGNLLLTQVLDWYPTSLVGIATDPFSNVAPPTVVLLLHSMVLFGLFTLLAPRLRSLCARPRVYAATARAGLFAMTLYLWHMFVLVSWIWVLHQFGWDLPVRLEAGLPVPDGPAYWLWLMPVNTAFGLLVYGAVRCLWPLEFMRLPLLDPQGQARSFAGRSALGVITLSVSILAVSGGGFSGFPFATHTQFGVSISTPVAILGVLAGVLLLRQPLPARRARPL